MVFTITQPADNESANVGDIVQFQGTADSTITQVKLSAEGRFPLGQSNVSSGNWSISYGFNRSGTRNIIAEGIDSAGSIIARHDVWIDINPAALNFNMQLTTNFALWELLVSDTADRLGLDNTPNDQEIANLRLLCQTILQPARDALGPIKINSGFRSEAVNRAVGGVSNSDHRLGFAADVVPMNTGTQELAKWVVDNTSFDQVILEFGTVSNPNWIHVSAAPRQRGQVLRATSQGGTTVYTSITI
ncbi:MAG: D-Ala-D-Ala carboxypeptidase family metallohydrolase [Thermosynechococcaceae cyanobacterium]